MSKQTNPQREYPLYLWPRNKVWMRAHKASIQNAATKVTDIGDILSEGSSVYSLRQIFIDRTIYLNIK